MSKSINCKSCGAANQMPEGRTSMFCSFCGSSIEEVISTTSTDTSSTIKVKPKITKDKTEKYSFKGYDGVTNYSDEVVQRGGDLSLVNRDIKTLDEIFIWFSDNELNQILNLILKDNKIKNLKGIERFSSLETLDLSNNNIFELPEKNTYLRSISKVNLAGNPIEKTITQEQKLYYPNIKFLSTNAKKKKIKENELSYHGEKIVSLDEIIDLYSENELLSIEDLDFSKNKLTSLKGLSNFAAEKINFTNNNLLFIDDLPKYNNAEEDELSITLRFNNNINLKEITEEAINNFYNARIQQILLDLRGCNDFNYSSLCKINFDAIFKSTDSEWASFYIFVDMPNNAIPQSLKQIGFIKDKHGWVLPKKGNPSYNKSGCFIATAAMGSYDHPKVMELRYFRDNWILQKSWGEGFVKWYYHYGAIAAKFVEKNFVLKKFCYLIIVKPLVYLSRILKK
jgi:hypothetical protein